MKMYKRYLHTILDKYNEQLKGYDVTIEKKDGEYTKSKREEKANKIIEEVKTEFKRLSQKPFLVIQSDNNTKSRFIAYNGFIIDYLHAGYASRIVCYLLDVLTGKTVDVSVNCKIVAELEQNVSLKEILQKLNED